MGGSPPSGTLNIGAGSGEAAVAAGALNASAVRFGDGTGTINFNHTDDAYTFAPDIRGGGTVTVRSGTTILTGTNTYTGRTTIYGGTPRAGTDEALASNTAYTVNGGTLDLNGHGLTMSSLSGTGGKIAVGGASLTVDQNGDTTFGGAITGEGWLFKKGSGTLTLTGENTYSNTTYLDRGTLLIEGSLGEGRVEVSGLAILGGTGTIAGHVVTYQTPTLAPGAAGVGTLTVGSLTLNDGVTLDYELGLPGEVGGGVNDLIVVDGDVTLDGILNVTDIGGFGSGIYRLINYGGEFTDNGLDFGDLPDGVTANDLWLQTAVVGEVNLVNTAGVEIKFWDGSGGTFDGNIAGGDGTWNAANATWTNSNGAVNGPWKGAFAVFQGASGTVTVDDGAGDISATGMQFAVDGYRVEGDAISLSEAESVIRVGDGTQASADWVATIASELTGDGGLVKTDLGTLVLTGDNTYTGGTTVKGGSLEVSSNSNLGASTGTLTLDGGTLRYAAGFDTGRGVVLGAGGGTFDTNGHDAGLSSVISGSGALKKAGAGTLTLSGANAYTGDTLVRAGTLVVTGPSGEIDNGNAAAAVVVGVELSDEATVIVQDGGTVKSHESIIGDSQESDGTVTVTGAGSSWRNVETYVGLWGSGVFTVTDGGEVINAAGTAIGTESGATGTVTVTGSGSVWKSTHDNFFVGVAGLGTLTIADEGTVSVGNPLSEGLLGIAVAPGSTGTLNIGAGTDDPAVAPGTLNAASVVFGYGIGTVVFNHTADDYTFAPAITGGGSVHLVAGTTILPGDNSYTGGTTLSGGTLGLAHNGALGGGDLTVLGQGATVDYADGLTISNAIDLQADVSLHVQTGTATQAGAIGETGDSYGIIKTGAGTLVLSATNTYTGSTTVEGGTLQADADWALPDNTPFTVNGGTLDLNGFDLTMSSLSGAGGQVALGAAALTIDQTVDTAFAGAISGAAGSLTKSGSGTLTLSGDSTYTGSTTVQGGTLVIQGSLGETAVFVAAGAVLGGAGTIGGHVTVADDGILAPGANPGTLTVGSPTLNDGSILDYELGQGEANDLIVVEGDLALDGVLQVADTANFGGGIYRLMNYGGNLTDNVLDLGTLPSGVTADDLWVHAVGGKVNLVNTAGVKLGFWEGAGTPNDGVIAGGDGIWNASNANWANTDGLLNGRWGGGFAVFQGTAGTVTVDDGAGAIAVTGMQFVVDGYRIEGEAISLSEAETVIRVGDGTTASTGYVTTIASVLTGTGGLVKDDVGTLVLSGANSYTGGTTVNGGTLQVSSDDNLGAANSGLTLDGGTLRYGADFDTGRSVILGAGGGTFDTNGHDAALTGEISGDGGLVKAGAGTLTLTRANTYTGGTAVEGGTLRVGADGALPGNTPFTVNGGTLDLGGFDLTMSSLSGTGGEVALGAGDLTVDQEGETTYAGVITGTGEFTKAGTGTLILTGDSSGFGGSTFIEAGTLRVDGTLGGALHLTGGRLLGTGTVGSMTVASGSTLAPGASIGTLYVDGDVTFEADSVYEVEVDADGNSDRIEATGQATLQGGSVLVLESGTDWRLFTTYTVLTADGGVNGTFDAVENTFAFLDPALAYGGNKVTLELKRNDVTFSSMGGTPWGRRPVGSGPGESAPQAVIVTRPLKSKREPPRPLSTASTRRRTAAKRGTPSPCA